MQYAFINHKNFDQPGAAGALPSLQQKQQPGSAGASPSQKQQPARREHATAHLQPCPSKDSSYIMTKKKLSLIMTKKNLPPRKDVPSFWRKHDSQEAFLHLGENPLPPTQSVIDAIAEAAQNLNRYPDTNAIKLREALADYVGHGVTSKNIIVGNGSDDLIDLAVVSFVNAGECVLSFEPSFFYYHFTPQRHGLEGMSIKRDDSFELPDPQTTQIPGKNIALTFIANPNNPTGTLTPRDHLLRWLDRLPGIVVADECYYEFSGETVVDLIHERENLIVFRSLSKSYGLAGIRLGYAVANEALIDTLERHALTFPVNALAQAAGIAVLNEYETYLKRIEQLKIWRDDLRKSLEKLGLCIPPSYTNFLLTLWPKSFYETQPATRLREQGILISDQTAAVGQNRPALRIAVGIEPENHKVLQAIQELMN